MLNIYLRLLLVKCGGRNGLPCSTHAHDAEEFEYQPQYQQIEISFQFHAVRLIFWHCSAD